MLWTQWTPMAAWRCAYRNHIPGLEIPDRACGLQCATRAAESIRQANPGFLSPSTPPRKMLEPAWDYGSPKKLCRSMQARYHCAAAFARAAREQYFPYSYPRNLQPLSRGAAPVSQTQ